MPINDKTNIGNRQSLALTIARARGNKFFGEPLEGRTHQGQPIFYMVCTVEPVHSPIQVKLLTNEVVTIDRPRPDLAYGIPLLDKNNRPLLDEKQQPVLNIHPMDGVTATMCVTQGDYLAIQEMSGQAFKVVADWRIGINAQKGHPLEGQLFLEPDYDGDLDVENATPRVGALSAEDLLESLKGNQQKNLVGALTRAAERAASNVMGTLETANNHMFDTANKMLEKFTGGKPVAAPTPEPQGELGAGTGEPS